MFSVCRRPFEASPPAPLRMERGVITEIPLHVLQMFSGLSPISSRPIGVTSHTTPLSIRRGVGGEASVFSVCRRPSVSSKLCAKKVLLDLWVLWEKKLPSKSHRPYLIERVRSLSHREHRRTEHTKLHRDIKSTDFTEPYSQQKPHPQPLSEWRGEWSPRYPSMSSRCLAAHFLSVAGL